MKLARNVSLLRKLSVPIIFNFYFFPFFLEEIFCTLLFMLVESNYFFFQDWH